MSKYFYIVRDNRNGNLLKGYIRASTKIEVIKYLRKEQYLILAIHNNDIYSIKEKVKSLWQKGNISIKQVILLCQQLSIMLEAGIEIIEALKIISNNINNKKLNKFIVKTINGLSSGEQLTDIWQREFILPIYLINSINIAEHTGLLAVALHDAEDFLMKEYTLKCKIQQIMIYPLFLLVVLMIVILLMIVIVIPTFADIFQRLDMPLPILTQLVLNIGLGIKIHLSTIFVIISVLGLIIILAERINHVKLSLLNFSLSLPIIGEFLRKLYLLKIIHQLIFLLNSGISIDESLTIMLEGNNNILVQNCLKRVQELVNQGFSLALAFAKVVLNVKVFQDFINIGEQTGMLAKMLTYLMKLWEQEIDNMIKIITQMLEPVLMIIVGCIVGVFILSIMLPLFDLVTNLGM